MKQRFVIGFVAAVLTAVTFAAASADTYVRGHTRSNGTYVAPHYRSSPDSNYNNNWSVQGNVNPHTGAYGTRAPSGTVPYIAPPISSFDRSMNNSMSDFIWNGR